MNKSVSIVFVCLCLCFVASVEADKRYPWVCGTKFTRTYLQLCVKPMSEVGYKRMRMVCRRRECFYFFGQTSTSSTEDLLLTCVFILNRECHKQTIGVWERWKESQGEIRSLYSGTKNITRNLVDLNLSICHFKLVAIISIIYKSWTLSFDRTAEFKRNILLFITECFLIYLQINVHLRKMLQ